MRRRAGGDRLSGLVGTPVVHQVPGSGSLRASVRVELIGSAEGEGAGREERVRMEEDKIHAGFHLLDVAALVVGYGLASMLVRAYWPQTGVPVVWAVLVIGVVYAWIGLAMSGPVVLLIRRPASRRPESEDEPTVEPRTWAEVAWLIIGFYWIGLTILVVPARLHGSRFLDSAFLGVFPVVAALGLRFFGPRRSLAQGDPSSWTHRVGVALLLTWPFAWVGLIVLGKSLI
jgi:hypothetical protein